MKCVLCNKIIKDRVYVDTRGNQKRRLNVGFMANLDGKVYVYCTQCWKTKAIDFSVIFKIIEKLNEQRYGFSVKCVYDEYKKKYSGSIEVIRRAFNYLKKQGKLKYLGKGDVLNKKIDRKYFKPQEKIYYLKT